MRIQVEGTKETIAAINKKAQKLVKDADEASQEAALFIEREWKLRAAVRTGRYRSSIHIQKIVPGVWVASDGVEYGIFVEFGTVNQAPQPAARPAADMARKQFKTILIGKVRST